MGRGCMNVRGRYLGLGCVNGDAKVWVVKWEGTVLGNGTDMDWGANV
jgi:hypothetical protein